MTGERTLLSRLFEHAPHGASVIAIGVGVFVLFGWAYSIPALTSVFPGLMAMKANAAVGFILAGTALWTATLKTESSKVLYISRLCSCLVLLIALLTLVEYAGYIGPGIDQMLIREVTHLPGDVPGRMGKSTAVCFASIGMALLLFRQKDAPDLAIHALSLLPIFIAGVALVSYSYDLEAFLRISLNYTPMAVNTALVFVVLGLGLISARPGYPFDGIMTSDSAAGATVRRLLPMAIGLQLLLGWLLVRGLQAGLLTEAVSLALFAVVNILSLGAMIQWNAALLYQADLRRRQSEQALRESERHLRELLAQLPSAVVVHGPDTCIRYGNARALNLLGLSEDQLLGKTAMDPCWHFVRSDGSAMPLEEFPVKRVIAENRALRDCLLGIVRTEGEPPVWVYVNAFPSVDSMGNLLEVVVTFVDISERKHAEEKLRSQQARLLEDATRDALTGLYNRRYLEETLQRELARVEREGHPLSILMADVDHFKQLNDTYGHPAGDEVLRTLGRMLLEHARSSDIPCRYGGEEFIVVLPDMPIMAALERAELIRKDFAETRIVYDGTDISVTLSIGVAVYPAQGETAEELIVAADQALYEAKQSGRNRTCSAAAATS